MSSSTDEATLEFGQVADEFVEAFRQGREPSIDDYALRYPEYDDQIRDLLPTLILMEKAKSPIEAEQAGVDAFDSAMIGRHLGDYEILREIGRGGMGVVYEARQISLGRHVALKVLPKQEPFKEKQRIRFEREAKAAARLHHTNIVPVFGVGEDDGLCYYVMQYIKGLGLDEVLDQLRVVRNEADENVVATAGSDAVSVVRSILTGFDDDAPPPSDTFRPARETEPDMTGELLKSNSDLATATSSSVGLRPGSSHDSQSKADPYWRNIAGIGMQVADALQYAHEQGVTHRDIKPSNLLLDVRNTVWITDFGLAKADDEANITHSGDILGTIRYMPPESFEGEGDARSDLYSLGITLYELATLQPAFSGNGRRELMKKVVSERPESVTKLAPRIPRDLATIIEKAIEREPKDRYQTAEALEEDLRRFIDDEPIRARRLSPWERLSRWSRRNRPLAASLLALTVLLIVVVVGSIAAAIYFFDQEATQRRLFHEANSMATTNDRLLKQSVESEKRTADAKNEAIRQAGLTERNLYSANMLNAYNTFHGHRGFARAQQLLERWRPANGNADGKPDLRGWEWYYIQALCNQQEYKLEGHTDRVTAIATDPKGERLASVSFDRSLIIWDLKQQTVVKRLGSPVGRLRCVAWDPKNRYVAAGGDGGMVVWAVDGWKQVHRTPNRLVYGLQWSPDGKRLARSGRVRVGKTLRSEVVLLGSQDFQPTQKLPGISRSIYRLQLSWNADGTRLVYPSLFRTYVWDVAAGRVVYSGPRRSDVAYAHAAHPTNPDLFLEAGRDAVVRQVDLKTKKVTTEFKGHTHGIDQIAWHPDGRRFASASWDGSVRIWDADAGKLLRTINGHERHAHTLAWIDSGERLLSAGYDRAIKCWRTDQPATEQRFTVGGGLLDAGLSPDGQSLVTTLSTGSLELHNAATGRLIMSFGNGRNQMRVVKFSRDGKRLVTAGARGFGNRGLVRLWDVPANKLLFERELPSVAQSVDWNAAAGKIAVAVDDGGVHLLDEKLRPIGKPTDTKIRRLRQVRYSPDGKRLAAAGRGGFQLLDVATGKITRWPGANVSTEAVAWSRSGRKIAVATLGQIISVWDATTGKKVRDFPNHYEPIYGLSWGPADRRLLSVDARGTLTLWDRQTGQPTLKLNTGTGTARLAKWSRDGRKLITNYDRTIVVLDATRGYVVEVGGAKAGGER